MNNKAVARSVEADNQYNAVVARLNQLVSLRDKKVSRTAVIANLTLKSTGFKGIQALMTEERVTRILGVVFYGAFRVDPRDIKVTNVIKSQPDGTYVALISIAIAANAESIHTINMLQNRVFFVRMNQQIKRLNNGVFAVVKADGVHEATFHDVSQPAWFVKSINAKIKSMQPELEAAKNEKILTDKLVSRTCMQ